MFKQKNIKKGEKGFTLIELLVVAAIIGILLALAIPNLLKARISANEANAAKMMQTLRDAEGEFFEQDLDNDGVRNYTDTIGTDNTDISLRCPDIALDCALNPSESLIDNSFETASNGAVKTADCTQPKAGYCIQGDFAGANCNGGLCDDYGWQASMTSWNKTGRRDYSVYGDGTVRCQVTPGAATSDVGNFSADQTAPGCN